MPSPSRLVLAVGFGVLLLLIAAIGIAGFSTAYTTQAKIVSVHQSYTSRSEQLRELALVFFNCVVDLRDALFLPGPETRTRYQESRNTVRKRLTAFPEPGEIPAQLDAFWSSAETALESPKPTTLADLPKGRRAFLQVALGIDSVNHRNLATEKEHIQELRAANRRFFGLLFGFVLLLGAAVAVFAWRRVAFLERKTLEHERELLRLSRSLVHAQEDERKAISRELHDELGQQLTGMGMILGTLPRMREEPDRFARVLEDARKLNTQTLRSVRTLALGLRPSALDDFGLQPALEWFTREFSRRSGIPVHTKFEGEVQRIPEPHRTALYRAVQEALTNAARHSRATRIDVSLSEAGGQVTLVIADNGVGFDPKSSSLLGQGLLGLSERIAELDGRFTMDAVPGRGARLTARVPIPEEVASR
jgi:signal transduction histidine kinase